MLAYARLRELFFEWAMVAGTFSFLAWYLWAKFSALPPGHVLHW
jgi:hypothetical protein